MANNVVARRLAPGTNVKKALASSRQCDGVFYLVERLKVAGGLTSDESACRAFACSIFSLVACTTGYLFKFGFVEFGVLADKRIGHFQVPLACSGQ
jgi:hypothetical protein